MIQTCLNIEYIIKEKRVSNFPIRSVECVRKVTRLECKFINDLFHIRDSIRTEFRVYEHNQSRIRRLYAFQARDFPHTFNAIYRSVRYSLLFYYILLLEYRALYVAMSKSMEYIIKDLFIIILLL